MDETDRCFFASFSMSAGSKNPNRTWTTNRIETDKIQTDRHWPENTDTMRTADRYSIWDIGNSYPPTSGHNQYWFVLPADGRLVNVSLLNKIDSYHVIMFKNIILLSVLPLVLTSYSLNNCLFLMKLQSYQIIHLTKFLHVPKYF